NYISTLTRDAVTPIVATGSVNGLTAGNIKIARGTGNTQAVDMWLYDSQLNAIPDDGYSAGLGSQANSMTVPLANGTYYLAVSKVNLANNLNSPAVTPNNPSNSRTGIVLDFPDIVTASNTTLNVSLPMTFTDSAASPHVLTATGTIGLYDVLFY